MFTFNSDHRIHPPSWLGDLGDNVLFQRDPVTVLLYLSRPQVSVLADLLQEKWMGQDESSGKKPIP